jgi:hypothetical protein
VSLDDYKKYANKWLQSVGANEVPYYRKNKSKSKAKIIDGIRFDYMVDIKEGKLYNAATEAELDVAVTVPWKQLKEKWGTIKSEMHIYALDRYGNLLMSKQFNPHELSSMYGKGRWGHTTTQHSMRARKSFAPVASE